MMAESAAVGLATHAGKEVISAGIRRMMKRSDGVDKTVSDNFKIEGREMTLYCPDAIQKYSLSITSKKHPYFFGKKKFLFGKVRRAIIRPVMSLQSIPSAIRLCKDGFELDLKALREDELYLLDVEYAIEDRDFLESLVERNVSTEPPNDERMEYWMVAQLKQVKSLQQSFGRIDLKDVDFGVNVAIHQDIHLKVPPIFRDHLETLVRVSKPLGRAEKFKMFHKLQHVQQQKYGGREYEILSDLQDLFLPAVFRKFVEVKRDFHYSDCERGGDIYDTLPFPTWPKFIKVISRTDLSFEKPAANGILMYKKRDFLKEIDLLFK